MAKRRTIGALRPAVRGDGEDLYWAQNASLRREVEHSRRHRGRRYSLAEMRKMG